MDRAAWKDTVHAVSKSPTRLSDLSLLHSKKANMINRCIFMPRIYPGMDTRLRANYSQFSLVQSLSCVRLFVTPWTVACQASLSITNSWSLLKLMSIELVISSNHLILCQPLLLPSIFPSIMTFPMSQFFTSGSQSIEVSASASVVPMNIQN